MIPTVSGNAQALLANEGAVREGIRNGQCHIISLAPVRDALGERWSKNEVLVEDFVLRTFRRGADSDDLIIKLNAVDYMVIQPSRSAMSALSRVTLLTRMTLNHFLGQARTEYIRVSFIEEATPGLITARRASTEQMLRATRDAAREQDPTNLVSLEASIQESPPWEPFGTKIKPRKVVIYKRPDSSELEATYYCEPIWNAAREAVGIFQLKTETFRVVGGTRSPVDKDDLTARTQGIIATRRLQHAEEVLGDSLEQQIALSVPLSLDAFAHSSSRIAIVNKLQRLAENSATNGRLFIELSDLPCSVSSSRVAETVAQIHGYVRRVTVRLPSNCRQVPEIGQWGVDGVILQRLEGMTELLLRRKIHALNTALIRNPAFIALDHVNQPSWVALASTYGLKELSGDHISAAYGNHFDVRPLPLSQILTEAKVA